MTTILHRHLDSILYGATTALAITSLMLCRNPFWWKWPPTSQAVIVICAIIFAVGIWRVCAASSHQTRARRSLPHFACLLILVTLLILNIPFKVSFALSAQALDRAAEKWQKVTTLPEDSPERKGWIGAFQIRDVTGNKDGIVFWTAWTEGLLYSPAGVKGKRSEFRLVEGNWYEYQQTWSHD